MKMDKSFSRNYSLDSFFPFPSEANSATSIQQNYDTHSSVGNYTLNSSNTLSGEPHYSSDSFIPFPLEENYRANIPRNYGRHSNVRNYVLNLPNTHAIEPNYTSDSFIRFSSGENSLTNFQQNYDRYSSARNYAPASHDTLVRDYSSYIHVPWKRNEYSCGVIGLHEEINDFYEKMRPTEQEEEIRLKVIEHITRIIHSLWPLAKVEVFGSFRTGLYLPSGDIDIVVMGEWKSLPLSTLSQALEQNGIHKSDITIVANAAVPIVKFIHTPSRVKVDISFNKTNGVQGVKLVKKLMKEYPPLPKLVLVLKQFLVQRGLNEVYSGGMSSYVLTLLIVTLLQGYHKPKVLPSNNLGTLLIEFFEHYGLNFNYERVSIHFHPGETESMYRPKPKIDGMLCVEDPFVRGRDLAKGTYMMHALKQAFENAFLVLHTAVTDSAAEERSLNSYLSLIVQVEDKLWEDRIWMMQNHSSILQQLSSSMVMKKENQDFNTSSKKSNHENKAKSKKGIFKKKQQR